VDNGGVARGAERLQVYGRAIDSSWDDIAFTNTRIWAEFDLLEIQHRAGTSEIL